MGRTFPLIVTLLLVATSAPLSAADARQDFRTAARSARHRDPTFQLFAQSLTPADALNVYAEVLEKLGQTHADPRGSGPAVLYAHGLTELDRALDDPSFRDAHLPGTPDDRRLAFQRALRDEWKARVPSTVRDARQAVYDLLRDGQAVLTLRTPAALVLEFVCGACQGLDDYTQFLAAVPDAVAALTTVPEALLIAGHDGIGYLRLSAFREFTVRELEDAVTRLRGDGLRVLIVDLRGNSGGLLQVAVAVAQKFQPHGIIATTQSRTPEFAARVFSSDSGSAAWDVPLVVLIDGKTMSAAEVVAAAWKEQQRATLVGVPTFGKGAVQSAPQKLHKGALIVTIAKLFGPLGKPLDGTGVTPHHVEPDPARQLDLAVLKAHEMIAR